MNLNRTGKIKFNKTLFVACLVGAAIGNVLAEFLYNGPMQYAATILRVGVYFAVFMACVALAAFLSELVAMHIKSTWGGRDIGLALTMLLLAIAAFFVMGVLFQFLYALGYERKTLSNMDDYLIAVDNSGSTSSSDPDDQRFAGVQSLVDSLNPANGFMVEVFDEEVVGKLDYAPADDQSKANLAQFHAQMAQADKGGTDIQRVLEDMLNNYQPAAGRSAVLILLSDGESDIDYDYLSGLYNAKNIPIFCVAFSNMSLGGERKMTELAEATNGYYCQISDLQDLTGTVQHMIDLTSTRNLLERRRGLDVRRILPMVMRLLFLTTLGVMVEVFLALILDYKDLIRGSLVIHSIFSVLAAIIMEFIFRFVPVLPSLMRMLMCLAMSVVMVTYTRYTYEWLGGGMDGYEDPTSRKGRGNGAAHDLQKKKRDPSKGKSLL